jgi:hypothetical protein
MQLSEDNTSVYVPQIREPQVHGDRAALLEALARLLVHVARQHTREEHEEHRSAYVSRDDVDDGV